MIRRVTAAMVWCVLLLSPIVAVLRLLSSDISAEDWNVLIHHGLITADLIQCASICVVLLAWVLSVVTLIQGIRLRQMSWNAVDSSSLLSVCGIALAGFLTAGSQGASHDSSASSGIDIRTVVSPTMAGLSAAHAIRKLQHNPRDQYSTQHAVVADSSPHVIGTSSEVVSSQSVAISTREPSGVAVSVDRVTQDREWAVVVRMYGHPRVENQLGETAEFRKRKALELLTWLSLNRDRPLRSAARTAMWEASISDSSFATVVSDMRRALSEVYPHVAPREWAPPTFTDDIVLSDLVTTDVELLTSKWEQFQRDHRCIDEVIDELAKIRDLPFAGSGYHWPDVDGTTTRLVIFGAHIAREAAYFSYDNKDWRAVTIAVTAGLRLIPGDEELLDLQRLVLQSSRQGLK